MISNRDPERFHIEKSDIVHDLERLASGQGAKGERAAPGRTVVSRTHTVTRHGIVPVERKSRQTFMHAAAANDRKPPPKSSQVDA